MAKDTIWAYNKNPRGNYWTWKCTKCEGSNLEKYKLCITCFGSKRPERTEANTTEFDRHQKGVRMNLNK